MYEVPKMKVVSDLSNNMKRREMLKNPTKS